MNRNTQPADVLLRFSDVTIGYPNHPVVTGVSFDLPRRGYIGIVGPNGSGKTTLLRTLLGTLKPLSGEITFERPVRFGYVPQVHTIDQHFPLSALDVVLMGRYSASGPLGRTNAADRERALQSMESVGLADLARRAFRDLSGGQRQRALTARALAADPEALVLDEPTRDLDIASQKAVMQLLDDLHEKRGIVVLLVSHDLNVVANHVADIAIVGGKKFATGAVADIVTPERLSDIYGYPIDVAVVNNSRVVI